MLTFDSLPQARIVRKAGRLVAPPPEPRALREPGPVGRNLRIALSYAVGLWPLTAVLFLAVGMLVLAGHADAP